MNTFLEKVTALKEQFESISSPSQRYDLIISYGKKLQPLDSKFKSRDTLVSGCQSELYINAFLKDGKIYFRASSDALISAGLAALLIEIYSGEDAETVISSPPHFLEALGIFASLSPNRSQGLSHIYLKMKFQAIMLAKSKILEKL